MELDIAFLAKVVGENTIAKDFLKASQTRVKAFNSVFWNENMGQWLDYWLDNAAGCKVVPNCIVYKVIPNSYNIHSFI